MEITEVRVKLVGRGTERLRAFCSITLDGDFVIRDLKVIDGTNGAFVAMPSRKLADRCRGCGAKNHLRAKFCSDCGARLPENRVPRDANGRAKLHADVAHPINSACRERIQTAVVEAYAEELARSKQPGYKPVEYADDYDAFEEESVTEERGGVRADAGRPDEADRPDEIDLPEPADALDEVDRPDDEALVPTSTGDSEYDSLISELKRDAASRRRGGPAEGPPARTDAPEGDTDSRTEQAGGRARGGRNGKGGRSPHRNRQDQDRTGPPREAVETRDEADRPAPDAAPAASEAAPDPAETEEATPNQEPDRLADFGAGIL